MKVKELIKILKSCNPESVVCNITFDSDEDSEPIVNFNEFEYSQIVNNAIFNDTQGNDINGNIIGLYS